MAVVRLTPPRCSPNAGWEPAFREVVLLAGWESLWRRRHAKVPASPVWATFHVHAQLVPPPRKRPPATNAETR